MGLLMRRSRDTKEKLTPMQELSKALKLSESKKEREEIRKKMRVLEKMPKEKEAAPKEVKSSGADSKAKS